MRHADAENGNARSSDAARELTPLGRRNATERAGIIQSFAPDLTLCSSATRAVQTVEALGGEFVGMEVEVGLYQATPTSMVLRLAEIEETVQRVLVVAHMPTVAVVARALVGTKLPRAGFAPAALAVLGFDASWSDLAPGVAELLDFHP